MCFANRFSQQWRSSSECSNDPPDSNYELNFSKLRLKCDGTRAETRFRLSAKRSSPFKSSGASVQSTTDSRGVRISGSNAGYTMFLDRMKGTGYPLHTPVSPSLPFPCVSVCHHISTGLLTVVGMRVEFEYGYRVLFCKIKLLTN